ncbi:predicted protein [Plenodomus lingam JN3]|uniref:Predicted protein n=1 Tax=Leptosphaeria maculans (strain JN3 / isolate v23.1.3 / race Av1-4-5-6-7-8) TaxID=985895 RepID=E4ZP51_LEPMJ|nr:predicted protein [Plenodomus lingam JN3]CBX93580.1 predicted protein [Plenodomus lingam JN3]
MRKKKRLRETDELPAINRNTRPKTWNGTAGTGRLFVREERMRPSKLFLYATGNLRRASGLGATVSA